MVDSVCGLALILDFIFTVDIELLAKLEDELKHEKSSEIPEFEEQLEAIEETIKHGEWQVKDVAGDQEVILTKKFGTEKYDSYNPIPVFFFFHVDDDVNIYDCLVSVSALPSPISRTSANRRTLTTPP